MVWGVLFDRSWGGYSCPPTRLVREGLGEQSPLQIHGDNDAATHTLVHSQRLRERFLPGAIRRSTARYQETRSIDRLIRDL